MLVLACSNAETDDGDIAPPVMHLDTTTVRLASATDTLRLHAEVARTTEERTMGLMERRSLADTAAMLFIFPGTQPADAGFWMYRTRIPLDIAFADSAGRVVAVRTMTPCTAQLIAGCPSYAPGQPYRFALEVNAGLLARRGMGAGARLSSSVLPRR